MYVNTQSILEDADERDLYWTNARNELSLWKSQSAELESRQNRRSLALEDLDQALTNNESPANIAHAAKAYLSAHEAVNSAARIANATYERYAKSWAKFTN